MAPETDRPLATPGDAVTSPAARVAAGAAWLDERRPDWHMSITEEINMASGCGCVLGQVVGAFMTTRMGSYMDVARSSATPNSGGYGPALRALGLTEPLTIPEAVDLGFHAEVDDEEWSGEWRGLTAEWTRLVAARKATS